ncbi:cytochrome o ubiquinol oxidase subunit IV [Xanthomonas graminis]|jgi:cytochrome o ubiquinol oxidase operon protein cyoD|uniref:Cytochrome bo(3) ubiquinol oxidase subunit 4 n=2 Tax=Xanthomonas graminis TaxID=3390026 RepID=A0A199P4Q5_9XANT|nr:cytochrome o ubiquinol oxidase subunit IV [Xanthomonas translucens]EKU26046.1 Cytochrome O ubiquinol oxidase subunit IV [Xanthomonas translucens pv. graminis ART-Xtg29]OAX56177.1 cytochrome o ubiquinol oxidase subunit IV [Xanthomonas translucens pv. poae]OAX62083.1 cytochrome o ubiquinol oxidase subunit IV [Xanthomonas translucens pv. graminis]UKE53526.1 cytochrome o ubiquinol oxidase subunit IV [Xanthomonas translucens pv. graminis]WIH03936.1 cytochrome o ubiquinol oxidase subunit IV [Xant
MANHSPSDAHAESHGSGLKSYLIGFVMAVVLTVIPFGMVMSGAFPKGVTVIVIAVLAALQMLVHLIYFLHMDRSAEQRSNVHVGLFSLLIIGIVVVGSLWVMHNLNVNMMH